MTIISAMSKSRVLLTGLILFWVFKAGGAIDLSLFEYDAKKPLAYLN